MEGVSGLVQDADTAPRVAVAALTVVVCTHDRPHYLRACLASLAGEAGAAVPRSVVVVDSASSAAASVEIAALTAAHGGTLVRLDRPGLSLARNAGLAAVKTPWLAYIDDDARVAPDWCSNIARAIARLSPRAAVFGGPIVPEWEAPCPSWWPPDLVPVLTILDWARPGMVGDGSLPPHVEPYGANMVFRGDALRAVGGFPLHLGRVGTKLLSGEEAWVMRALRDAGWDVHYDPDVVVTHCIQASRLTPGWLLSRQYWSGASEAMVALRLGDGVGVKALRMALHAALRAPLAAWPGRSSALIRQRCALAFASGYLRGVAAMFGGG
jgi:glycosyltransferase involved in cell wall biosynthesis